MPDEDAAAAAVRFCFSKGLTAPQQVLDIVGYLKGALEGKGHEPDNIELLRTAGAYSRRAAESAKEESYADAAAGTHPPIRELAQPTVAGGIDVGANQPFQLGDAAATGASARVSRRGPARAVASTRARHRTRT